jgi:hypothetical protein
LLDTTGAFAGVDNNRPVFFIAGTFSTGDAAGAADRTFDVPAGKPLLIPMLAPWLSNDGYPRFRDILIRAPSVRFDP